MGLRYFGIRVTDLERSRKFYTELFGLRLVSSGEARHGGRWVLLQDPRTRQRLELNWYPPGSPFATPYRPGDGLDHLGFRVSDPKGLYRRLRARGVPDALVPADPNGLPGIYYLLDPDGNWLEIYG